MDVMGDKATLLETGRFVQPSGPDRGGSPRRPPRKMRQRLAAEAGDVDAMSVLGAMLLRRGDLDGAEPICAPPPPRATAPPPTTSASCSTSAGTPTRPPAGGGSPPSPAPPRPRTRSAGTTASAATSPPPSTGCASPPSRATPWARTRSPTCWSTAGTSAPSAGCGPPPSAGTGRPPTAWPARSTGGHGRARRRAAARSADDGGARRADEAEQWYRQAAARGHRRAALHLGAILEQRGELKEAGRWYLTSAKDGEARAACALGFLLRDAGDEESAAVWWLRAAQDGDGNAANALGALHAERGETADRRALVPRRAWTRATSTARTTSACSAPSRAAPRRPSSGTAAPPTPGTARPPTRWPCCCSRAATRPGAEPWFSKAAEAGSVDAAFNLGILYAGPRRRGPTPCAGTSARRPPGTPRRRSRSASRGCGTATSRRPSGICGARRAAAAPRPRTGWRPCSTRGARAAARPRWGSPRAEKTECEEWYERAAEQGHRRAQVRVGHAGGGAAGDVVEAARWYREAAEAGQPQRRVQPRACCWPGRAASRRRRCGGPGPPTRATDGPRCGSRCSTPGAGELAEGQRWAARAVELGPAEVAERAARLREALRQELVRRAHRGRRRRRSGAAVSRGSGNGFALVVSR